MAKQRKGRSYEMRVAAVNEIYDTWVKTGLSNREIWRRYIYPQYGICERTFYSLLKASTNPLLEDKSGLEREGLLFPELADPQKEINVPEFFRRTDH